jgi:hypothetical protein
MSLNPATVIFVFHSGPKSLSDGLDAYLGFTKTGSPTACFGFGTSST